jgi:hypothetical protein
MAGTMDDPLRTEFNGRYGLDALHTDFGKRLGFAAASSLWYFDSGSEEDRECLVSSVRIYYLHTGLEIRCISGDYAVDEILPRAGRIPYDIERNQEAVLTVTADSGDAKGLKK